VNEIKFNKSEVNLKQLNKNKTKRAMDSSSSRPYYCAFASCLADEEPLLFLLVWFRCDDL